MRLSTFILAGAAFASSVLAGLEDAKYSKKLTASNFDSTINGKNALVAFFAPWCGHCKSLEPTWTKVAKAFEDEPTVVVGHLDADNADNRPTSERFGVKGFPTIKFFPADGSAPVDYQLARTEDAFLDFINEHAGTHRTPGGLLNTLAGRIPNFDELVATFLSAGTDARDSVLAQAKQLASQFSGKGHDANATAAAYYLKVMDKLSSSNDWAQKELARLQKMASKRSSMAGKQLDDLQVRQNILAAFTAARESAASIVSDASASVGSVAGRASASASSVASAAGVGASSASGSASSASAQATGSAKSAASGVSASASSVASAASASASSAASYASSAASSAYKKVADEL